MLSFIELESQGEKGREPQGYKIQLQDLINIHVSKF